MSDQERLLREAKDPDEHVRQEAVASLGDLGLRAPEIIDVLVSALLDDGAGDVRAFAAGSLGKLRDPFGADPLRHALDDRYWRVRSTAAWALHELGDRGAVPLLAKLCADPNAQVRGMAAEQLGCFGGPDVVEPLIGLLADSEPDVLWSAVLSLSGLGDGRALEPLKQLVAAHAGTEFRDSAGNNILSAAEQEVASLARQQQGEA